MFSVFYIIFEIIMFIFDKINKNYKLKSKFFKEANQIIITLLRPPSCVERFPPDLPYLTLALFHDVSYDLNHVFEYVMMEGKLFNMY